MTNRPAVSVIVPFHGDEGEGDSLLSSLTALSVGRDDELLIVDNTEVSVMREEKGSGVAVVRAPAQQSSYYARNVGAERAANDWLLFVDSDCRPPATLLDDYFTSAVDDRCGIVAGGVRGAEAQRSLVSAWARSRGHVGEGYHVERRPFPAGITANLLVRTDAWEGVGGFHQGIRSGADLEFCWRVQEAGWGFDHRPGAMVEHVHVDSLRALLRKGARYGAGRTWMERRYPGSAPRPSLARELGRALAGGVGFTLTGQPKRGVFKLVDGAWYAAIAWGHVCGDNRAVRPARSAPVPAFAVGEFPGKAAEPPPDGARVVAVRRPARVTRSLLGVPTDYLEDDPPAERAWALACLIARHPVRAARVARDPNRTLTLRELAPAGRRLRRSPIVAGPGGDRLARLLAELAGTR